MLNSTTFKRVFDVIVALPVVLVSAPLIFILVAVAQVDTNASGLFRQQRVGRGGVLFTVYKIRTMRASSEANTVTVAGDSRITWLGSYLRRAKLDELPQFWNVLTGRMSLVGPRPDVAGYADMLVGSDRVLLSLRPGVTGPATLLFRGEEQYLSRQEDPSAINDEILWPAKVRINCLYAQNRTLVDDLVLLDMTLRGSDGRLERMLNRWDPELTSLHPIVADLTKSI